MNRGSKNFDEMPICSGEEFSRGGGQCSVTQTSRQHCSHYWGMSDPFCCMRFYTDDWIIPLAPYTTAEIPSTFQWARQPQNCSFTWGISPHRTNGSLSTQQLAPQTAPRLFQPFLHSTSVWPTNRHIDHATCAICSSRPHLMQCMQFGLKMN